MALFIYGTATNTGKGFFTHEDRLNFFLRNYGGRNDSGPIDVWVIGNDWYGNDYYMDISKRFEELGVETVWIPYTKGISSSQLRENPRVTKNYKDKEEI